VIGRPIVAEAQSTTPWSESKQRKLQASTYRSSLSFISNGASYSLQCLCWLSFVDQQAWSKMRVLPLAQI
jgi:hypothetical protein